VDGLAGGCARVQQQHENSESEREVGPARIFPEPRSRFEWVTVAKFTTNV